MPPYRIGLYFLSFLHATHFSSSQFSPGRFFQGGRGRLLQSHDISHWVSNADLDLQRRLFRNHKAHNYKEINTRGRVPSLSSWTTSVVWKQNRRRMCKWQDLTFSETGGMRRSGRKCQPSVKVSSEDFVTEQNGMDNTAKPSKKRGIKG